jgi:hypothetical protein
MEIALKEREKSREFCPVVTSFEKDARMIKLVTTEHSESGRSMSRTPQLVPRTVGKRMKKRTRRQREVESDALEGGHADV